MQGSTDYELFELGDIQLQLGMTLRDAFLAYKTYGTLNADKTNAIVYPTWYSGRHADNEWLIGEGMALDPTRYFIIVPNMLGNGLSSSPSNTPPPYDRARFPRVTSPTRCSSSTGWSPRSSGSRRCRWSPAGRWVRVRLTSGRSASRTWSSGRVRSAGRRRPASTTSCSSRA